MLELLLQSHTVPRAATHVFMIVRAPEDASNMNGSDPDVDSVGNEADHTRRLLRGVYAVYVRADTSSTSMPTGVTEGRTGEAGDRRGAMFVTARVGRAGVRSSGHRAHCHTHP